MYSCIIFDIDGTLVDTEKAVLLSLKKWRKSLVAGYYRRGKGHICGRYS